MFISIENLIELISKLPHDNVYYYKKVILNGNAHLVEYPSWNESTKLVYFDKCIICPTSIFRYNGLVIIEAQSKIYVMDLNVY